MDGAQPTWPQRLPVDAQPPAEVDVLAELRQDYPHWGILWDLRATWYAVRGTGRDIVRTHPVALRAAIEVDRRNTLPRP
jgi:hypothetical protein